MTFPTPVVGGADLPAEADIRGNSTLAVVDSGRVRGGFMAIPLLADRNALDASVLRAGMLVYVVATSQYYRLADDGVTWVSANFGSLALQVRVDGNDPVIPVAVNLVQYTDNPFSTYAGPVAFLAPAYTVDGLLIRVRDVGNSVANFPGTITGQGGMQFQNPGDGLLYDSLSWGPGSGGGPNPDMVGLTGGTWISTTVVKGGITTHFWQLI